MFLKNIAKRWTSVKHGEDGNGELPPPPPSDPSTLGPGFESHGEHSTPSEVSIKFSD